MYCSVAKHQSGKLEIVCSNPVQGSSAFILEIGCLPFPLHSLMSISCTCTYSTCFFFSVSLLLLTPSNMQYALRAQYNGMCSPCCVSSPPHQVKTGMLRSEHQKNASRTIKETVDTEMHKRNKERDKDKERLQNQQSTQEPVSEGEGGGGPSVSVPLSLA